MKGWYMAGSYPTEYDHGIAEATDWQGRRVAFLESNVDVASGFGTLMQSIDPEKFAGKRIRLAGSLRTTNVDGWAGLWLRVDGPHGKWTAFDNMQDRAVGGTTEWTRPAVVLDVASDSVAIAFGTVLCGTGRAEMAHFEIESVGTDIPTTGKSKPIEPENMDFADD